MEIKYHTPPKVLIVDDISVNVEILREILSEQGYEPLCALSVQEALDIMKENMPQLILTDFTMPGMNGLEFCRLLKSNPITREIPLIFVTVADSSSDKKEAFEAGVADFIGKPFDPTEVIMRVKNHLNTYYFRQEMEDYNRMMHKMVTEQKKQLEKEQQNVLLALAKVVQKRNIHSRRHVDHVGDNSRLLAQSLQLIPRYESRISNTFIETIGTAARLHDIGNLLLPDEVFFKEYASDAEREETIMRFHTEEGARFLEEIAAGNTDSHFLDMAIQICRYHHAWWDGSGYPEGVGGADIPLAARITSIVNDFHGLLGGGYNREAHTVEESVRIINERSGRAYDSRIVEVFNKVVKQMKTD